MFAKLCFERLKDDRLDEAFDVLQQVGEYIRENGRQQRIANINWSTYQQWQVEGANFVVLKLDKIVGLERCVENGCRTGQTIMNLAQYKCSEHWPPILDTEGTASVVSRCDR